MKNIPPSIKRLFEVNMFAFCYTKNAQRLDKKSKFPQFYNYFLYLFGHSRNRLDICIVKILI
ncbi:MAG: hypothetical protein RL757_2826 [Bacteroidota bacterium]|jgi:hypothetical protein